MRTIVNGFLRLTVAFAIPVLSLLNWAFADELLQFNRDVQPILGDRCYACHGPDEDSREADLRLDQRDSALGTNAVGAAIVPGRPSLSELIHRINSDDPDEIMPPPSHNKPLSDSDKKVLSSWIAQGAKYERHWSFTPPRRSKLPMVGATDWPINPIDHFVLARLQEAEFVLNWTCLRFFLDQPRSGVLLLCDSLQREFVVCGFVTVERQVAVIDFQRHASE